MRAVLVQRRIAGAGAGLLQQLGDDALMHVRILPHVEPGEMEAEHIDRAPQLPQPAARQHRRAVGFQRALQQRQIGEERAGTAHKAGAQSCAAPHR